MKAIAKIGALVCAAIIGTSSAGAGSSIKSEYKDLKEEILKALPKVDSSKQAALDKAQDAEKQANADLKAAQERQGAIAKAKGLVDHAKGKWISGAEKGLKAAQDKLKNAKSADERKAAEAEVQNWEKDLKAGQEALANRQKALDAAMADQQANAKALEKAKKDLALARDNVRKATDNLGLASSLSSDKLDGKLAKFVVLHEADPDALQSYASKNSKNRKRIEMLLDDEKLLIQAAVADGAAGGNYIRAMEIYEGIQEASENAAEGPLQRLALAVSLEHAQGVRQRNIDAATDASAYVDPIQRYLGYEKAFLAGELDPMFKNLTVWDMRMVVDGEEPVEISVWGREMLRNYRPDLITHPDYRWRYVELVRTDVPYGSQDNKYDRDDLHFFQNILMNGGVCGRRAFIGRFILRSFGIPTIARPQKGHAALAHWTPDGWVICLGAGWGKGWTKTPYGQDLDFLATTQARALGDAFMQVKRAQWIGDVMGEPRVYGLIANKTQPGFWNATALNLQRTLIADAKTLAAVGEELGEANESDVEYAIHTAKITNEDREVSVDKSGVITIPAAATSAPRDSTRKIHFMASTLGGLQLHYSRGGGGQDFEYTVDAPKAGTYELTALVATPSWRQSLVLNLNGTANAAEIPLPHTVGLWGQTEPVRVELKRGKNELRFSHKSSGNGKGFTIRDFTLKPASAVAAR